MRIDRCRDTKTGRVYVYEAESYYIPEKKRCGVHRKLLGYEDPVTGELRPTGKRGRPRKQVPPQPELSSDAGKQEEHDRVVKELRTEIAMLRSENAKLKEIISSVQEIMKSCPK